MAHMCIKGMLLYTHCCATLPSCAWHQEGRLQGFTWLPFVHPAFTNLLYTLVQIRKLLTVGMNPAGQILHLCGTHAPLLTSHTTSIAQQARP